MREYLYKCRGILERKHSIYKDIENILTKSQPSSCLIFKSKTLVKLRLGGGYTLELSHDVYLPMLKTLWIDSVDFDGVFENLLSRCPVLEDLVLLEQRWVHWSCSVSSSLLKRLSIRFDQNLSSISFDAPNLVYFYQSGCVLNKYPIVKLDSLVEATLKFRVDETRMQGARDGYDYCISTDMINLINGIRNLLYFSCQEMPLFGSLVRLSIKSD